MAHIPKWCAICKGRKPKTLCHTENLYICTQCNLTCFKYAHNWTELENEQEVDANEGNNEKAP